MSPCRRSAAPGGPAPPVRERFVERRVPCSEPTWGRGGGGRAPGGTLSRASRLVPHSCRAAGLRTTGLSTCRSVWRAPVTRVRTWPKSVRTHVRTGRGVRLTCACRGPDVRPRQLSRWPTSWVGSPGDPAGWGADGIEKGLLPSQQRFLDKDPDTEPQGRPPRSEAPRGRSPRVSFV